MKHASGWILAALALCWTLTGCGKKPATPEETAAAGAKASAAGAEEAVAPVAAEAVAPVAVVAEPALSEAEAAVVVAKVNDQEITEGEIHKVMGLFKKQMGQRIPPDQMGAALPRIRERIVEELIMRRVMLDEVAKQGISISDSEFAGIKAELAQELPPDTTMEAYMAETGTTEAAMREQMAVRKMIIAKADAIAKPTDEEIQKFYDENKDGFTQGESVGASHILIKLDPADDDAAKAAKRERLEGLRKQILDGADFAELAKANSDCPSASSGGDLGSFSRGQMVPEFEDAAFAQPVGSVGDIVETQFGYHLIKVTEHNNEKTLTFDEAKPRISEILYSQKQQDAVKIFVDGLRGQATIQRFDTPPAEETMLQLDMGDDAIAPAEAMTAEAAPVPEAPTAMEEVKEAVKDVESKVSAAAEEVKESVVAEKARIDQTLQNEGAMMDGPDMVEKTAGAVEEMKDAVVQEGTAVAEKAETVAEKAVAEVKEMVGESPSAPADAPVKAEEKAPAE